jgi:hypothetical protein
MSQGVQFWYYTAKVPSRAVAVAKVSVPPMTPAQLTSVNNTVYEAGPLSLWKSSKGYTGAPDFTAPDYNQPIQISGDTAYFLSNQFFQLSNVTSTAGNPMFFKHSLPVGVSNVTILDLNGESVVTDFLLTNNTYYHSLDGAAYSIRYVTAAGYLTTALLNYNPVVSDSQLVAGGSFYEITGRLLTLGDAAPMWIRFTQPNGFQIMPMYGYLPNAPWYVRIRFGMQPPPVDWIQQRFVLPGGYLQATYVDGTYLTPNLIEFERKEIYVDPQHLPDILIFDQNNNIKYALDGSAPSSPLRKGTLYNWKRGAIQAVDSTNARVSVNVTIDPTDIVYGFYNYYEPDIIYTDLDINPFTNSSVKNAIIEFYVKFDGGNPLQNIYHQIFDPEGNPVAGGTNDPAPTTGTNHIFSTLVVGASVSSSQFGYTDVRVRGGGLAPQYQNLPQASSFFDIGYWDGKPYPIGGALVVYLPLSILDTLSRSEVQGKVQATIPMGSLAVVRYFDAQGNESV